MTIPIWGKMDKTLLKKTKTIKGDLRCRKHPGYAVKAPPQGNKAFPTGCPVCIALWETFLKEAPKPEIVTPEVVDDNGNGDEYEGFKSGPENPNWSGKVDPDDPIHLMIRKYTRGGEAIVREVCKIAGVLGSNQNLKGVAYRDKIQALKWLADRGWGPVIDPDAEGRGGLQINILNIGEGTFQDYTAMVQSQLKRVGQ